MMADIFRPQRDPARAIYDALLEESTKRSGRTTDEWIEAEREVVWRTARDQAQKLGLRVPTLEEVTRAENSACGHVDYAKKWAYRLEELMRKSV